MSCILESKSRLWLLFEMLDKLFFWPSFNANYRLFSSFQKANLSIMGWKNHAFLKEIAMENFKSMGIVGILQSIWVTLMGILCILPWWENINAWFSYKLNTDFLLRKKLVNLSKVSKVLKLKSRFKGGNAQWKWEFRAHVKIVDTHFKSIYEFAILFRI